MKSRMGVTNRWKRSLTPASTPRGMAMTSATSTDARVRASSCMAGTQSPCSPMKTSPPAVSRATRQLPTVYAIQVASAATPSQPMVGMPRPTSDLATVWVKKLVSPSMTARIGSKK
jgi:hypothetical protein